MSVRWRRGEIDHHSRGYVGTEVRFTLHRHTPPNNSHFAIWVLFAGDVGPAYDGPNRQRLGTFGSKRDAQSWAVASLASAQETA